MELKPYGGYFADLKQIEALEKRDKQAALKKACQEFEALFLYQILKGLEETVPKSGLFPESLQKDIYHDLFYQQISKEMAKRGVGLARVLYQRLQKETLKAPEDARSATTAQAPFPPGVKKGL